MTPTPSRPSRITLTGGLLAIAGGVLIAVAIASRVWCVEHADATMSVLVGIAGLATVIVGSTLIGVGYAHSATKAFAHGAMFGANLASSDRDDLKRLILPSGI